MTHQDQISLLLEFVKEQHGDQKRKYTGDPYWHHLKNVADIVEPYNIPFGVEIALCHDLLEDTTCVQEDFADLLYERLDYTLNGHGAIIDGIWALADQYTTKGYPEFNRSHRKRLERERLAKIHPNFQSIKYADIIDNAVSIKEHDPGFWKVYQQECLALLEVMDKGNKELLERALKSLE